MNKQPADHIILTSDEPWCEIWHTQLHYAFQLSRRVEVIFLGPPNPWKFSNLWNIRQQIQQINKTLTVVTYFNLIPASLGKFSLWVNDQVNSYLLRTRRLPEKRSRGLIWHFDPHRSMYLFKNDKNYRHIFHVIDPIAGCNLDIPLAKMADMVVVTSPKFIGHYEALNNNVIRIPQGVDTAFYKIPDAYHQAVSESSADSIMLLGTISDQIHFKLLGKIASKFPGKLVLIGPDKTISETGKNLFRELLSIDGVKWLGAMNPEGFRKHLKACRVGIIAYDNTVNYKNDFRSPLKVISYLGCGKSIISNIDCEIPSLMDQAIYHVNDDDEFFGFITQAYEGTLKFNHEAVHEFLDSIDYNNLLSQIFDSLDEQLPGIK